MTRGFVDTVSTYLLILRNWLNLHKDFQEIILGLQCRPYEKTQLLLQYAKITVHLDIFSRSVIVHHWRSKKRSFYQSSRKKAKILPSIHPTINYGVVHAVGHRQPVYAQKDFLDVRFICNLWQIGRHYEVHMKR